MKLTRSTWVVVGLVCLIVGGAAVPARAQGVIGGAELTVLKAHGGSLSVDVPGVGEFNLTPGFDPEVSPRVWLGYQTCNGLAFKVRFWKFDQEVSGTETFDSSDYDLGVGLEAETLDFELSQTGSFCNWEVEVAGGIRWAQLEDSLSIAEDSVSTPDSLAVIRDFHGMGPTVALAARRPIGCGGLALIGNMRLSLLYGDTTVALEEDGLIDSMLDLDGDLDWLDGLALEVDDHLVQIYEIQLGVEWTKCTRSGAKLYARAVLEAQTWQAPLIVDSTFGFVGPSFAFGIER